MRYLRQFLAILVAWGLLGAQANFAQTTPQPPQAAQQSTEQLQQLVAPIALYPDSLIAQILPAATYPEQIVEAVKWIDDHKGLQGDQLATAVDGQPWDASVKALTQFPAVLANMKQNLAWTSELGDAYVNQQPDVAQAIQTMRERAKQAGNLKSSPKETVKTKGQTIVIEPTEQNVIYVPEYDPWLVYGDPLMGAAVDSNYGLTRREFDEDNRSTYHTIRCCILDIMRRSSRARTAVHWADISFPGGGRQQFVSGRAKRQRAGHRKYSGRSR
jgi:uncharacterized protein DUF3300